MQLSKFQTRFKDTMLDHPKVLETPPEDLAAMLKTGDIPLPERLKVYRNNIVGGISDILISTFPMMEKLVGKDFLENMTRRFLLQNPPESSWLSLYGTGFDKFIEGFKPAQNLPYLRDVARLEIALNDAYFASDDEALTPEDLLQLDEDNLVDLELKLRESVRLIESEYPLSAIRDFCSEEEPEDTLDLDQGGEKLMVYRPALDTVLIVLEDDAYTMLSALQDGLSLGEALEQTLDVHPAFDVQDFLATHIELETFLKFPSNVISIK